VISWFWSRNHTKSNVTSNHAVSEEIILIHLQLGFIEIPKKFNILRKTSNKCLGKNLVWQYEKWIKTFNYVTVWFWTFNFVCLNCPTLYLEGQYRLTCSRSLSLFCQKLNWDFRVFHIKFQSENFVQLERPKTKLFVVLTSTYLSEKHFIEHCAGIEEELVNSPPNGLWLAAGEYWRFNSCAYPAA